MQQSLRMIGELKTPRLADPDVVSGLPTFRAATGSLLLQQFRDLQDAMAEVTERREVERLAAMLRAAA